MSISRIFLRPVSLRYKNEKTVSGKGFAPDPTGGSLRRFPDPL